MSIDRRTLTKGAAWTIPVLTIAATAPSLAASPQPTTVTGFADKCPGTSDVPGGYPKHGYRIVLTITPTPATVVPVQVEQGNGKTADIITSATDTGAGWEFIIDADSSPSKLIVTVNVDGQTYTVAIKASPHCGRTS